MKIFNTDHFYLQVKIFKKTIKQIIDNELKNLSIHIRNERLLLHSINTTLIR